MSVTLAIPEHFLMCGRAHCPVGGALPSGSVVAMRGCTWSAPVFGWICVSSCFPSEHCIVPSWSMLVASLASGFNVWADQHVFYWIIIHSHIISIVSVPVLMMFKLKVTVYSQVIITVRLTSTKTRQMSGEQDINRQIYLCVLTLWKKALWSIKEMCFVSSLNTMWHNSDDRGTSAQCKKSTNIFIRFAVSKVFKSEKAAGRNVTDKHNYFQFKSCSFKSFLNQEAWYW